MLETVEKMRHIKTATEFMALHESACHSWRLQNLLPETDLTALWTGALRNVCLERWNQDFKIQTQFGNAAIALPRTPTLLFDGITFYCSCVQAMQHIASLERVERNAKREMKKSAAKK
jgi:hypothetical protein